MLWEKIMLAQILNRPSHEPSFISKLAEPRETTELPAFMTMHDGSPRAIFARVRDRFLR